MTPTDPQEGAVWPPPPSVPGAVAPAADPAVAALLRRSRTLALAGCLTIPLVLPPLVLVPLAVRDGLRAGVLGGGRQGAGAVAEAVLVGVAGLAAWGLIAVMYLTGAAG